mgnify:CR=1 FL=1
MQYDILVVKADGSGNFEWSRLFGLGNSPSQDDYGLAVACLDDGSYVMPNSSVIRLFVIHFVDGYEPNRGVGNSMVAVIAEKIIGGVKRRATFF